MNLIRSTLKLIRKARPFKSVSRQFYEMLEHKLRINTNFRDYYRFEFYKSNLSWTEKSMYLGPNGSKYWPHEYNSLKYESMFAVKSIQKTLLMGAGLPTPRMFFKVGSEYPICTLEQLRNELSMIDVPIVCKFDGGGGGQGVHVFDRADGKFFFDGKEINAEWIWSKYEDRMDRGFIIEERVKNHPALDELYPHALNTMRLAIVKTADGQWHFLRPFLKIGQGGAHVDNLSAKSIFTGLNEDGVAGIGYCKYGDLEYECHPDSGTSIVGFQVPFYREALELAEHASQTLGFMRTFGWDMAVTPDGPMIIEANPSWLFQAVQQRLGPLLKPEVAAGLMPRSWYTPWDKTHNYPHYLRHTDGGLWQRLLAERRNRWQEKLRTRTDSSHN